MAWIGVRALSREKLEDLLWVGRVAGETIRAAEREGRLLPLVPEFYLLAAGLAVVEAVALLGSAVEDGEVPISVFLNFF